MAKKQTASGKRVRPSGGARMKTEGKTPVMLGIAANDLAIIDSARQAGEVAGDVISEPRATFILRVALDAAKKIVEERKKR